MSTYSNSVDDPRRKERFRGFRRWRTTIYSTIKNLKKKLGYPIEKLMNMFDRYSQARLPYERMWKLLDAYDSGEFWKSVAKVMPSYSIRPDNNWVNWVKENYVNSLYVGSYRGDVFCREYQHEDYSRNEWVLRIQV